MLTLCTYLCVWTLDTQCYTQTEAKDIMILLLIFIHEAFSITFTIKNNNSHSETHKHRFSCTDFLLRYCVTVSIFPRIPFYRIYLKSNFNSGWKRIEVFLFMYFPLFEFFSFLFVFRRDLRYIRYLTVYSECFECMCVLFFCCVKS